MGPLWYFFWFPLGTPTTPTAALLQNRAGIARAAAVRSNGYTPNLVVEIRGIDRTSDVIMDSIDVSLASNDEPDTASFSLQPTDVIYTENQLVYVSLGSVDNPIFGGSIINAEHERRPGYTYPFIHVECQSWLRLFDRRLVTASYTNMSATAILRDVLDKYTSGFSASAIADGMAVIDDIQITNERPSTVFRKVTGLVGGGFRIDGKRTVHAWSGSAETGPHAPTPPDTMTSSLATLKTFEHSRDASQQRNRVIVQGGGSRTVFEAAAGNTELVIEDATYFSESGGTAIVGRNVITYTGLGTHYVQSRDWDTQLAPELNRWRAMAWSPELGVFAALSFNGTNRAMYSTDGKHWALAAQVPYQNGWVSAIWAPALAKFVGLSFDGDFRVVISTDAIVWDAITASEQNAWSGICWAEGLGLLVAVAVDGTHRVMTSPDSFTWTNRTAGAANQWVKVVWSESLQLLVAIAANAPSGSDAVMTSTDGVTWTTTTLAFANWSALVRSEELGLFVALNSDETDSMAAYSYDGIGWSTVAVPAGAWIGLTWAPELGLFVACSERSTEPARIITSPDGITWSTDFTDDVTGNGASIAWSAELGIFVVGTDDDSHPVLTNEPTRYPTIAGIPSGGEGSLVYDVPQGEDVKIRVQVDDAISQVTIAALEGGDGIYEHIVQDGRYNIAGATARANAELAVFAPTIQSAYWDTNDMRAMPGGSQQINFAAPDALSVTLPITRVSFRFDTYRGRPIRSCEAATVKESGIADVMVTEPN